MKKFMLAAAVLVAASTMVSCGGGNPEAQAEALVKEMKAYAEKGETDPAEAMKKIAEFTEKAQDILKSCKTAEDSAKVEAIFDAAM